MNDKYYCTTCELPESECKCHGTRTYHPISRLYEKQIQQLQAENERLREALHNIYEYNSNIPLHTDDHHVKHFSKQIDLWANEALEGK